MEKSDAHLTTVAAKAVTGAVVGAAMGFFGKSERQIEKTAAKMGERISIKKYECRACGTKVHG